MTTCRKTWSRRLFLLLDKLDALSLCLLMESVWNFFSPTMKKKIHYHHQKHNSCCNCKWRKVVLGLMCVITAGLITLQALYMPRSVKNHYFNFAASSPKVAFLFIARNRLTLDFVWERFFQVINEKLKFNIELGLHCLFSFFVLEDMELLC